VEVGSSQVKPARKNIKPLNQGVAKKPDSI